MLNFLKKNLKKTNNKLINVKAAVKGNAIEIIKVPDDVFSSKMMGDGVGIDPEEGMVYSPVDGKIVSLFPTKHAVCIKTNNDIDILIHIGIDTVNLKGEGFESFVNENDIVKTGDKLISFDLNFINKMAKSSIITIIVTNMDEVESIDFNYGKMDKNSNAMIVKRK